MNFEEEEALDRARLQFNNLGRVPYDTSIYLMGLGFIVHELEEKWEQENSLSTAPNAEQ